MFSITVKSDMKVNILIYLSSIVGLEKFENKDNGDVLCGTHTLQVRPK